MGQHYDLHIRCHFTEMRKSNIYRCHRFAGPGSGIYVSKYGYCDEHRKQLIQSGKLKRKA